MKDNKNIILVENWLLNEWDGVRIPITEVQDILDLGILTYEKILKDNRFKEFLKDNGIEMLLMKRLGETIYFNKKMN